MILTRHDENVQSTSTNIYGFEFVRVCEGIRGGNCKLSTARLRKMMDRRHLNRCFFSNSNSFKDTEFADLSNYYFKIYIKYQ